VTTLKLHYDGWLALPADLRRKLGLGDGAELEIEIVEGTVVLRPSDEGRGSAAGRGRKATEPPVDLASSAPPSPRAETPAAREGDRARQEPDPTPTDQASRPKRPRGRPRKAEAGPAPAPLPGPAPLWELRRKVDRPVVTAGGDDPAPDRRPVRLARERVHGHEPEERRPFRNVEVRKLGPGRGHDRPRASRSRLQLPGQRTG
jgi:bifunctional DNA-binding transcriptional regulator/antitoxin component of YhaV-PrlF toxin-antitoxin module